MSLIGGCLAHPEWLIFSRMSTGAPQLEHELAEPSLSIRQ
jgi:hypothetical protein